MESTYGDAIEFETSQQDTDETRDNVARGLFYAMVFSLPCWVAIGAVVVALTS